MSDLLGTRVKEPQDFDAKELAQIELLPKNVKTILVVMGIRNEEQLDKVMNEISILVTGQETKRE